MKKIYLDTNIYNKLLDFVKERNIKIENLSERITSNGYVILFNKIIFEEILQTAKEYPDRARDLFQLSYNICSKDYIIKYTLPSLSSFSSLLGDDLRCFLKNNSEDNNPFIKDLEKKIFIKIWKKVTTDNYENITQDIFDEFRGQNIDFLTSHKQSKEEFLFLLESNPTMDFQEFYQTVLNNEVGVEFIKDICAKCLGEKDGNLVYQKLNLTILSAILRHLRFAIKSYWGLRYLQLAKNRNYKWGDNIDIHHITLSSVSDIFVTNEERLHKLFDILKVDEKRPKCVDFEKFKKLLKFS